MNSSLIANSFGSLGVRYAPGPKSMVRIPEAIQAVQEQGRDQFALPIWNHGTDGQVLRSESRKMYWLIAVHALQATSINPQVMFDDQSQLIRLTQTALDNLKVDKITRCGFQMQSFVDLGMKHSEMVEQLFGTLLPEKAALSFLSKDFDDAALDLYGTKDGMRFRLRVLPQKPEEVKGTLSSITNLDLFQTDKFSDELSAFWNRIDRPSLFVDIDVWQADLEKSKVSDFIQRAMPITIEFIDRAVKKLISMPVRIGS